MADRHNSLAQRFIDLLKPEARPLIYQMMQEHQINPDDSMFLALLLMHKEAMTLEEVDKVLQDRKIELQALYQRVEKKCDQFCKRADEFVIESDKLRSEIKVSDNITKYVAGSNRLRDLNTASSPVRLKPLPIIVGASVAALILGIFIAVLLLLLVLR
ncbi:hypothetical protein H6F89_34450 [Cyanobacteria bacterium FACHB-63]|nr:hypothetical protein [Cyanobacteria bacterium FACHB-63]